MNITKGKNQTRKGVGAVFNTEEKSEVLDRLSNIEEKVDAILDSLNDDDSDDENEE